MLKIEYVVEEETMHDDDPSLDVWKHVEAFESYEEAERWVQSYHNSMVDDDCVVVFQISKRYVLNGKTKRTSEV